MTAKRGVISQDTFEHVLARAVELDEEGSRQLTAVRAREIALDLGVSPAAWDEAVAEYAATGRMRRPNASVAKASGWRHALLAVSSLGVGIAVGARDGSPFVADWVVDAGTVGLLVAVALALLGTNAAQRTWSRLQVDLAVWWLPFPVGFSLGLGRFFDDPFAFAILGWLGSAAVGGLVAYRFGARTGNGVDPRSDHRTA
jgi:hypothetical protein